MSEHNPTQGQEEFVPTSYAQASNGEFLTADDLQGRQVTVTLTKLVCRKMPNEDGGTDNAFVYSMAGKDKRWRANRTNLACLRAIFGEDPKAVIGQQITLVSEVVQAFGERKPAIRVYGSPVLTRPIDAMVPAGKGGKKRARKLYPSKAGSTVPEPPREPGDDGEKAPVMGA
jgi:hypothetical protein